MIHHHEKTHYAFSFMQCAIAEELLKNLIVVACNCERRRRCGFYCNPQFCVKASKSKLEIVTRLFS